jgi:hypothetical protein
MSIQMGKTRMQTFYTVLYDWPSKKTGKMIRKSASYVEDLERFRAHVEKRGGKIVSESAPRQEETIPVYF